MNTIFMCVVISGALVMMVQTVGLVVLVYLHMRRPKPQAAPPTGQTANPQDKAKVAFHYALPTMAGGRKEK